MTQWKFQYHWYSSNDCTAVFRDLSEYYFHSRVAEIAAADLEIKISTLKFDSKWTTGATNFLNYLKNLIYDLEEVKGEDKVIPTHVKREWLIRCLSTNTELETAVTQWHSFNLMVQTGTNSLNHDDDIQYANLLKHLKRTATDYDVTHTIIRAKQ